MASGPERIDQWVRNVQHWRREEEKAVDDTQLARRAKEKDPSDENKHQVQVEEAHLAEVRKHLDQAEDSLDKVRAQWAHKEPLEKREDIWRDRVQDLSREAERAAKTVRRLRREEKEDRDNAIEERREAIEARGTDRADVEAEEGKVAGETLVYTRKKLTAAEERLVKVRGLNHHAQMQLAIVRKDIKEQASSKVPGKTARERVVNAGLAACHAYYAGKRKPVFYSQTGRWTVEYGIEGEHWGMRSDCSQWATACYYLAGAPDPNGQNFAGGYTGTLVAHCHHISRDQLRPGDLIVYGGGVGHHVELYLGDGKSLKLTNNRTGGHGSPPVDFGVIDLIPGTKQYLRCPGLD